MVRNHWILLSWKLTNILISILVFGKQSYLILCCDGLLLFRIIILFVDRGIFLDETSSSSIDTAYYYNLSSYIYERGQGDNFVVINPGVFPDESYIAMANITVVFEQHVDNYLNMYEAPDYVNKYPAEKFSHLIYGAVTKDEMLKVARLSFERHAGYVYTTHDELPNPWDATPPYYQEEISYMNEQCGHCDVSLTSGALAWIVAHQDAGTGLISSFDDFPVEVTWALDKSYVYDQAVGVIALLLNSNNKDDPLVYTAEKVLNGISQCLTHVSTDGSGVDTYSAAFSCSSSSAQK